MKLTTLEDYIKENVSETTPIEYQNEEFCCNVLDYLGMKGYEITKDDETFLQNNGYSTGDFDNDNDERF